MTDKKFYMPGTEIDQELHQFLKELADREKRSMTGQILWILEDFKNRNLKGEA